MWLICYTFTLLLLREVLVTSYFPFSSCFQWHFYYPSEVSLWLVNWHSRQWLTSSLPIWHCSTLFILEEKTKNVFLCLKDCGFLPPLMSQHQLVFATEDFSKKPIKVISQVKIIISLKWILGPVGNIIMFFTLFYVMEYDHFSPGIKLTFMSSRVVMYSCAGFTPSNPRRQPLHCSLCD